MSRYTGLLCESCKKPFADNDDIVVCPDCGAPHHRSCYMEQGHCALQDKHDDKFVWQAHKPEADGETLHTASIICPACNAANPPHGRHCQMCGASLKNSDAAQNGAGSYGQYEKSAQSSNGQMFSDQNYAENGAFERWDINGITSRELSAYTGSSSYYFLRQFKLVMSTKYNMSWNWSAFIFGFFYFLYRKMYKVGLALMGFYIVSMIPGLLIYFGTTDATIEIMGVAIAYNSQMAAQTAPFMSILNTMSIFLRIWCAFFANKLYLKNVLENINQYKEIYESPKDTPEYYNGLHYHGKPNRIIIALLGVGLFVAYSVLMNFINISPI